MTKRFRMVAGPNGSGKLNSPLTIDVMDEAEALYGVCIGVSPLRDFSAKRENMVKYAATDILTGE